MPSYLSCRTRTYPWIILSLFLFSAGALRAADATASIQAQLAPQNLSVNVPAILTVTVNCPAPTQDETLQILAPPGFTVTPASFQLGTTAGVKIRQFEVQTPHTYFPAANWNFLIILSDKTGDLANLTYSFKYEAGVSLWLYFLFGIGGIAVGYIARLVVDSLNNLPKPVIVAAVPPPTSGVPDLGWFTKFIKAHYYLMDFFVTLVLGFLALVALVKDNHAPDSGLYWYSALGLGFGLGLLTNSDLVTRLRTK